MGLRRQSYTLFSRVTVRRAQVTIKMAAGDI